jgi:hypothetical protein
MTSAEPQIRVVYHGPLISIDASGVTVAEILRELGRTVGFAVVDAGASDARHSFSIHEASLPVALHQLLRSENHVLLYREGTQSLATVMVLGARVARAPTPFNQPDPLLGHSDNENQGQMNPAAETASPSATPVSDASPATPADLAEYRRLTEGSPEVVNATDLLLRHAGSGLAASPTTPASRGGPVAASSASSTDVGAADPGSTLATTTRLAQQNLMKLVQGLSAATSSLLSSRRR